MNSRKTYRSVRTRTRAGAFCLHLVVLAMVGGAAAAAANEPSLLVTSQLDHTVKEYDGTTGAFIRNAATGIGDPLDAIIGADGNVLVTDGQENAVQRFDRATGSFLGTFASAVSPVGMTLSGNKVYVCQGNSPQIVRSFDAVTGADAGSFIPTVGEGNPAPRDVKVANGRLYVAYWNLGTIEMFDLTSRASLGLLFPPASGGLTTPFSIAFGPDGDLYVSYAFFVNRYHPQTGEFLGQFIDTGDRTGQRYAVGIAWGPDHNLYVATQNTAGVQRYRGTTGAFLDDFVPAGDGGLTAPYHISFTSSPECAIEVAFDFTPGTIGLPSNGLWAIGFIEPPPPLAASDIDIASIRLNGTVPVAPGAPSALGDHDDNGIPDLMVKFDRAAVEETLPEGDHVPVTVTGSLGGECFTGVDTIRVRRAVVSGPLAGSRLSSGSVTSVRWQTPSGVPVQSVAIFSTIDGGSTWNLVACDLPNSEAYRWTVPDTQTDQAKLAVLIVESSDETGNPPEGILGLSEAFSISSIVGVEDGKATGLALRGVLPNPARGELRVRFSLEGSLPASLALFDVGGRQIDAHHLDGLGPGWHMLTFGGRKSLTAGVYVIRLTQGGRSLTTRVAVIR